MPNATTLPALKLFQWSRPSAPNPRLAAPIDADDTTITFTSPPLDESDAVVASAFLMGIRNNESYVETVYVPAGALSVDGLTATGVTRGIDLTGRDYTTGDSSLAASHQQDSPVFCNISGVYHSIVQATLQGTGSTATGGVSFTTGNETDTTNTIQVASSGGVVGWLRLDLDNDGKVQYKNNGGAWTDIDDVSSSNLVLVSANDTTPGYLNGKLVDDGSVTTTLTEQSDGGNETLQVSAGGALANIVTDVTATSTEINQALDGISANVTDTNLNTLVAGSSSNADSLHTHSSPSLSFVAFETVSAGDAVALLPIEIKYYDQLTEADADLGDADARRRYAVKFRPTASASGITQIGVRLKKTGAPTHNIVITVQGDSGGNPDGTPLVTATYAGTALTTSYATYNAAFDSSGSLSVTEGTDYWLVFDASQTDVSNYFHVGVNSSYDENYLPLTRKTYDSSGASWGNAVTNASPFFWIATASKTFGKGVVQTDADFGGRTWNFIGIAKTGGAADASIDVYYEIADGLTGLTPNEVYWLSTTPGAITTTKPNGLYGQDFAYQIGRASDDGSTLILERNEKRIPDRRSGVSATTTYQYILWFKPAMAVFSAQQAVISNGWYDGTNNYSIDTANGASTSNCFNTVSGGNGITGVASGVSDIGFTLTATETGTGNTNFFAQITG